MREPDSSREAVLENVIRVVNSVAAEWDFEGEISESSRLFSDLNWQSVDMVVLAYELQELYDQPLPFREFLAETTARELPGVTIGELTDFVVAHLASNTHAAGS